MKNKIYAFLVAMLSIVTFNAHSQIQKVIGLDDITISPAPLDSEAVGGKGTFHLTVKKDSGVEIPYQLASSSTLTSVNITLDMSNLEPTSIVVADGNLRGNITDYFDFFFLPRGASAPEVGGTLFITQNADIPAAVEDLELFIDVNVLADTPKDFPANSANVNITVLDPDLSPKDDGENVSVRTYTEIDTTITKRLADGIAGESIVDDGIAQADEILTYIIRVQNNSGVADSIDIVETLPAGTSYYASGNDFNSGTGNCTDGATSGTCEIATGDIPANGFLEFTYKVKVNNPINVSKITNIIVKEGETPPDCTTNPDLDGCSVTPTDTLNVVKTVDGDPATAAAGQTLVYNIAVTNNGDLPVTDVVVTEKVPEHTTFSPASPALFMCSATDVCTTTIDSIPVGDTVNVKFAVTVDSTLDSSATEILNIVLATPKEILTPQLPDNCDDDVAIAGLDCEETPVSMTVDLDKTAAKPVKISENQYRVVYTITATNNNSGSVMYDVTDEFDIPSSGVTISSVNIEYPASNTETSEGSITQKLSPFTGETTIVANEILPGGGASEFWTVTAVFTVDTDNLPTGGNCDDGSGSYLGFGNKAGGVNVDADDAEDCPILPMFEITKSVKNESIKEDGIAQANEEITYEITVANNGTRDDSVDVTERVPAGATFVNVGDFANLGCETATRQCTLTTPVIAAGATQTFEFTVTINSPITVSNIVNSVVEGEEPPRDCINDSSIAGCSVLPTDTLSVVKTVDGDPTNAVAGDLLVYTISVTNNGDQDVRDVLVTEKVPAFTDFVPASSTGFACVAPVAEGSVCTATISSIATSTTREVKFAVRVKDPLDASATEILNIVLATPPGVPTPVLPDNCDDEATIAGLDCVETPVSMTVELDKTVETQPVRTGTNEYTVVYRITAINNNAGTITYNVTDEFNLPSTGVTIVSTNVEYNGGEIGQGTITQIPANPTGPSTIVTNEMLAGGGQSESWLITAVFAVTPDDLPTTGNCDDGSGPVLAFGNKADGVMVNEGGDEVCPEIPQITITKTLLSDTNGNQIAESEEELVYQINVQNDGLRAKSDLVITEIIPKGTTFLLMSSSGDANLFNNNGCNSSSPEESSCETDQLATLNPGDDVNLIYVLSVNANVLDESGAEVQEIINYAVEGNGGPIDCKPTTGSAPSNCNITITEHGVPDYTINTTLNGSDVNTATRNIDMRILVQEVNGIVPDAGSFPLEVRIAKDSFLAINGFSTGIPGNESPDWEFTQNANFYIFNYRALNFSTAPGISQFYINLDAINNASSAIEATVQSTVLQNSGGEINNTNNNDVETLNLSIFDDS